MQTLPIVLTVGLWVAATQVQAACEAPPRPSIPDGDKASMDEMLAGQKSVKAFQQSNMDYMQCLEAEFTAAKTEADAATESGARDAAQSTHDDSIEAYNSAVSAEEEVAGEFNVALRKYKAANR